MKQNGSSEILNKLYDTAMDKLEGVKKDYDALRKRYNEKIASHNTDLSRLEQAEEENRRLQKQIDMLMKQRDTAIHFQQQYSSSLRRYNQVLIPFRYSVKAVTILMQPLIFSVVESQIIF